MRITYKRSTNAFLTILCLAGAHAAYAAPETAPVEAPTELEEVVVTAEKRSENLQKAPTTISVVSGADLLTQGIDDISAATAVFPSVKFGQISGTTHLYIRGIGAEQDRASIDPLSAMTENGVPLPREVTGNQLFDLGNIQVLPGPQSTLYSTSAAGGIVAVVDNRPTNTQEGSLLFETGNYDLKHVTVVQNQMCIRDSLDIDDEEAVATIVSLGERGGSGFSDTGTSGFPTGHRRDRREEIHEDCLLYTSRCV